MQQQRDVFLKKVSASAWNSEQRGDKHGFIPPNMTFSEDVLCIATMGWVDGCVDICVDVWQDGWMGRWMCGWTC